MQKRIVITNGRKYIVNAVAWDDSGPGSGAPAGQIWLKSTDGNWYAVSVTGTSSSAALVVNQTPLGWIDPGGQAFGYSLIKSNDGNVYSCSLSGSGGHTAVVVSSTPWSNQNDYNPFWFLQSPTDGCYYNVALSGSSPPVLVVNQNSKANVLVNR